MKIIRNKHNLVNKRTALIVLLVIFASLGLVGYYYFQQLSKNIPSNTSITKDSNKKLNDINLDNPTNDQITTGNDAKKNTIDKNSTTSNNTPFVVTITAVNQNSNFLQIRTLIDAVSNNGTCELTLSQGNKTLIKTTGIQALANSSTCAGFDIPINELSSGDWEISLKVTIDAQNNSAKRTVQIL